MGTLERLCPQPVHDLLGTASGYGGMPFGDRRSNSTQLSTRDVIPLPRVMSVFAGSHDHRVVHQLALVIDSTPLGAAAGLQFGGVLVEPLLCRLKTGHDEGVISRWKRKSRDILVIVQPRMHSFGEQRRW